MRILIIIIFSFFSTLLYSQNKAYFDSITYYQYISHQYKKLVKTGKKALKNNIDFYYLRYRMAFSNFENKKYISAIPHFLSMLEMNPSDDLAMEYLYYCYIEMGMTENAYAISENFTEELKRKLNFKDKKFINYLAINYGNLFNSNTKDNENISYLSTKKGATETKLQSKIDIFDFMIKTNLSNRSQLLFQSSYFLTNSKNVGQIDNRKYVFDNKNNNLQLSFVFLFLGRKNWKMSSGFAYFYNNFDELVNNKPIYNQGILIKEPFFSDTNYKYNSYLFSFKTEKIGKIIQPMFGFSYAKFYSNYHLQLSTGLSYYPLGNYKLYGKSMVYFLTNGNGLNNSNKVFHQIIGFQLYKNVWAESVFMFGGIQNINIDNGILTFNTSDPVKANIGLDIIWNLKKFSFIPSYRFQNREFTTTIISNQNTSYKTTSYFNHIINFTVKWLF